MSPKSAASPTADVSSPIKPTFDRNPKKLPFFLNQVWPHLDCSAYTHPDDATMVNTVVANLEGEAAECVTSLHDEGAP